MFDERVAYDRIFASAILGNSHELCEKLKEEYGNKIVIGGTGWNIKIRLPEEVENMNPDYSLYTAHDLLPKITGIGFKHKKYKKAMEIVNAGIGYTSRGCVKNCPFCIVRTKEGPFRQASEIRDIINPRSNTIILFDKNFTADPFYYEKLQEIKERSLVVDFTQGLDIRMMTEEKAKALSEVRHLRAIHYAWDNPGDELSIRRGIKALGKYIKPYRQMCFMLTGFDTSHAEDIHRAGVLCSLGVTPYVMKYNQRKDDVWLNHFTRWINGRFHKVVPFREYQPWIKAIEQGQHRQMKTCIS